MNLRPANPINSAIRAYDAVDRIASRRREEARLIEDRDRQNMDRAQREMNQRLEGARMALESGDEQAINAIDPRTQDYILQMAQKDPGYGKLFTESGLAEYKTGLQKIDKGLLEKNWKLAYQGANTVFAPQLNRGTAEDGQPAAQKSLRRVHPGDNGKFVAELDVTRSDGQIYQAPRTKGAGHGAEDEVMQIDPEALGAHTRRAKGLVKMIEMRQVTMGNNAPVQRAIDTKKQAEALAGLAKAVSLNEKEVQTAQAFMQAGATANQAITNTLGMRAKATGRKTLVVGSDKTGRQLIDAETGEKIKDLTSAIDTSGSGDGSGGGKGTLVTLKTVAPDGKPYQTTIEQLRKNYDTLRGKGEIAPDAGGSVPSFEHWANSQTATPYFSAGKDPALWAQAQEDADKWVDEQAGYLSTDGSDFKAYGGNREQARIEKAEELYAMRSGQAPAVPGQPPQAAQPPASMTAAVGQAIQAIDSGKDPQAVTQRLEEHFPGASRFLQEKLNPQSQAIPAQAAAEIEQAATPADREAIKRKWGILGTAIVDGKKHMSEAFANSPGLF